MEAVLRCINLSKYFGTLPALRQIDFQIKAGEVVGLTGRSGSGKPALVNILSGIEQPSEGDLYIAGQRMHWPFSARRHNISVINQQPILA